VVDTRPVSGPSFAENRAYLLTLDARDVSQDAMWRRTSDRPPSRTARRIENVMPEQLSQLASSAAAGRTGRRIGGRSGL